MQSLVSSSAASFQTAKSNQINGLSRNSLSRSASSSVNTLGASPSHRDPDKDNSIPTLSLHHSGTGIQTQEVHLVKLNGDAVHVEAGPVADSFFPTLGKSLAQVVPNNLPEDDSDVRSPHIGPPPQPSPASVDQLEREHDYLHPNSPRLVSSKSYRPVRRYTTGSSPKTPTPMHSHGGGSQPITFDEGAGAGELANDIQIQIQAEQIRRQRMSKRAKAQQEAEAALTRQASRKEEAHNNVLVGNLIGEDHVNYVLMYNMLTGIRIGVSYSYIKVISIV
jgi:hypothetical protein